MAAVAVFVRRSAPRDKAFAVDDATAPGGVSQIIAIIQTAVEHRDGNPGSIQREGARCNIRARSDPAKIRRRAVVAVGIQRAIGRDIFDLIVSGEILNRGSGKVINAGLHQREVQLQRCASSGCFGVVLIGRRLLITDNDVDLPRFRRIEVFRNLGAGNRAGCG